MNKTRAWVCADTHFGHPNIIRYRTEFNSYEEHDNTVLENILSVVGKNDTLWILGDECLSKDSLEYLTIISNSVARLRVVLGNHSAERQGINFKDYIDIADSLHGMVKKKNCWLTHAPIHPTELRGCYNIHGHCVDGDTEVLTTRGWLFYNQIEIGQDYVVGCDKYGNYGEYLITNQVVYPDYKGEGYSFKAKGLNMLVTDLHRVAFKKYPKASSIEYLPAKEAFARKCSTFIRSALPDKGSEGIELEDNMLALYIWLAADGHVTSTNLCRFYLHKERKQHEIKKLLNKMQIDFKEHPQKSGAVTVHFYIPEDLVGWNVKGLDRKLVGCNRRQAEIVRDVYRKSDGNRNLIFTSKKGEVDILQELFTRTGFATKCYYRDFHGFSSSRSYQINVTDRVFQTSLNVDNRVEKVAIDELVWCITTESGNFFARRNGGVFLTGNCHDKIIDDRRYYNVSMEQTDYKPVLLVDVMNELREWTCVQSSS